MKLLQLLPIGDIDLRALEQVGPRIAQQFHVAWDILQPGLDPQFAYHAERQQYHSTELLARMHGFLGAECWRLLGVTGHDLYIPILTFVFGEAQMGGPAAVVSTHRLQQEFYGLPADEHLSRQRLMKEAVHELGHTLDLRHCDDYRCAMAASHAVEWIDLKENGMCPGCSDRMAPLLPVEKKTRFRFF
ncbi:MAG: archaemetzincin family Zn-dependent metalloprotease [Acidobacteriia bacterium]|nr:archaemetzincin family Zn-dependent metalloprotease [Terriglobia bacterium]